MRQNFADTLAIGGKSNSLGKASEVIELVLKDESRLEELYACLFNEDAWVRMRAADALEKVCRQRPGWLQPYVDRFFKDLAHNKQPSIQWHLAQIFRQVDLSNAQKRSATAWLKRLLTSIEVDWIVAANAMDTLAQFVKEGSVPRNELLALLKVQQHHKSNSVVKRANKLLNELSNNN